MNLTVSQIEVICIYMNWKFDVRDMIVWEIVQGVKGGAAMIKHPLDLNDSALCVEKMVEKGDWDKFEWVALTLYNDDMDITAWLFNADNFFAAMAAWLRSKQ